MILQEAIDTTVTVKLVAVTCCNCGVAFGMSDDFHERRRRDHGLFYCPAGHSQHFTGKSDIEKLREELAVKEQSVRHVQQQAEFQRKEAIAAKAAATKLRNRVSKGVCPCCNRTFTNLARHMKTKHPEQPEAKE